MKAQFLAGCRWLTLMLIVAGCAHPLRSELDSWPRVGDEFANTLRWAEPTAAESFASPEVRTALRQLFGPENSLKFIDVRHSPQGPPLDSSAKGQLSIEYYRVSSSTVKKVVIPVEWSCIGGDRITPCVWRISHLPDKLP